MKICKITILIVLLVMFGCHKTDFVKVKTDDICSVCNTSCFRGIEPDMYYKELLAVAGEPNEFYERKRYDEADDYNPTYYSSVGKLMGYWSGNNSEPIGLVEYTPYRTSTIQVEDFIYQPKLYNIDVETDVVAVFKEDTLYYLVFIDSMKIKQIEFWKAKKKFGNIADKFD